MFGEDLIIGHIEAKLDTKNRLYMPSFTKAEIGEKIISRIYTFDNDSILKLYAYQEYIQIIDRLKKLRDNTVSFDEYEKYNLEIEKIIENLASLHQIDNQRRITINGNMMEKLNWNSNNYLELTGLGYSLQIKMKK